MSGWQSDAARRRRTQKALEEGDWAAWHRETDHLQYRRGRTWWERLLRTTPKTKTVKFPK